MTWFNVLLALHIAGGGAALVSGPVAIAARKGSRPHILAGRVYAGSMAVAAGVALPLAAVTSNALLLVIGVFTLFLVHSGVTAIRRRRRPRGWRATDLIVPGVTFLFSAGLLWRGLPHDGAPADVTSLFFGALGGFLAAKDVRAARNPTTNWLQMHITGMLAAYIATVTAFLVVNLTFLPQAVVFVTPTLIGTPLIAWMSFRHTRRPGRVSPGTAAAAP